MFASLAAAAFSTSSEIIQTDRAVDFDRHGNDSVEVSPVSENIQDLTD